MKKPNTQAKKKTTRKPRRRGNGQGTVWKQGSVWRWQFVIGERADGGRIVVSGKAATSLHAHQALAEAIADHKRKILAEPNKITIREFTEVWLSRQYEIEARTVSKYRAELEYVLEHIGDVQVQDATHHLLTDAIVKVSQRKMSGGKQIAKQTLARVVTRLKAVFKEAVLDRIIYANPMADVKKPKLRVNERARLRFLDFPQEARFLMVGKALHDAGLCRIWPLIYLLSQTGLRCSEACGLRWQDVDFDGATITIRKTRVKDVTGYRMKKGGKTESAERTLPVPPQLLDFLREQKAVQNAERRQAAELWQEHDFVFTTQVGHAYDGSNVNRALRHIVAWSNPENTEGQHWIRVESEHRMALLAAMKAGPKLPHISAHDLRHTYATLALRRGVDVTVVSKALGHKDVAITLSIYRHVLDDEVRQALAQTFQAPPRVPQLPDRILN